MVDDDRYGIFPIDPETPGLAVVAAGRPAGQIKDALDLGSGGDWGGSDRLRRVAGNRPHHAHAQLLLEPLADMAAAAAQALADETPGIGVELVEPGGGLDVAAVEQDLQRFDAGDSGAELAGHGGGGAALIDQIKARGIDQI